MESRKRKRWLIVLTAGTFAFGIWFLFVRNTEPSYEGKRLSEWVTDYWESSPEHEDEATSAIITIGTNALPYLADWIAYEPSPLHFYLASKFRISSELHARNHSLADLLLADSRRADAAVVVFKVLGAAAGPAIPGLQKLARRPGNSAASMRAILALYYIGPEGIAAAMGVLSNFSQPSDIWMLDALPAMGTNAAPLVPVISSQLQNTDGDFAVITLAALGNMEVDLSPAVPALTRCLADPRSAIRMTAIPVLEEIGPAATAALPALERLRNDPDQYIRSTAAEAIEKIKGNPPE